MIVPNAKLSMSIGTLFLRPLFICILFVKTMCTNIYTLQYNNYVQCRRIVAVSSLLEGLFQCQKIRRPLTSPQSSVRGTVL